MNRKKVVIADDEADARLLLKEYLDDYPEYEIIAECANGIEAIAKIEQLEPDIVFLDIQMPGMNGFQVLQHIIYLPRIIFSTAFDKYAIKAFEHNAVDYLLKPYSLERFSYAMGKLKLSDLSGRDNLSQMKNYLRSNAEYPDCFFVEYRNKFISIKVDDVSWLEADGNYTKIFTNEGAFLSSYGIGEIVTKLPSSKFVRIHRSVIVNINHVSEVHRDSTGTVLLMKNGITHKVSRGYADAIKKLIF